MFYKKQAKYISISIATYIVAASLSINLSERSRSQQGSRFNHSVINQPTNIKEKIVKVPNFQQNSKLQEVVDSIVKYANNHDLPVNSLSISLIDIKTGDIGGYNSTVSRYPASIVKIFWLISAHQKFTPREIQELSISKAISEMILESDNQAANQVLEAITQTKSTIEPLSEEKLEKWQQSRKQINTYYHQSGYSKDFNISQKTFPIVQRNNAMPIGADRQIREDKLGNKVRNKLTTDDATRLMYEIVVGKLLDFKSTTTAKKLLQRNLSSSYWKQHLVSFNPIEGFFGEGLSNSETNEIISKAGRTSSSRQEVAFINSKDGKVSYILTIFGDDPDYSKNKKVFPDISRLVYRQMQKTSKQS